MADRPVSPPEHNGIPDDYWREVPCGHPPDPVALWTLDGHAVCHCGTVLNPADLIDGKFEDLPGPIVHCQKCGCYMAIPRRPPVEPEREANRLRAGIEFVLADGGMGIGRAKQVLRATLASGEGVEGQGHEPTAQAHTNRDCLPDCAYCRRERESGQGEQREPCKRCGGCSRVVDTELAGMVPPGKDWMPCPDCVPVQPLHEGAEESLAEIPGPPRPPFVPGHMGRPSQALVRAARTTIGAMLLLEEMGVDMIASRQSAIRQLEKLGLRERDVIAERDTLLNIELRMASKPSCELAAIGRGGPHATYAERHLAIAELARRDGEYQEGRTK